MKNDHAIYVAMEALAVVIEKGERNADRWKQAVVKAIAREYPEWSSTDGSVQNIWWRLRIYYRLFTAIARAVKNERTT